MTNESARRRRRKLQKADNATEYNVWTEGKSHRYEIAKVGGSVVAYIILKGSFIHSRTQQL
jgi:hypothetical protein